MREQVALMQATLSGKNRFVGSVDAIMANEKLLEQFLQHVKMVSVIRALRWTVGEQTDSYGEKIDVDLKETYGMIQAKLLAYVRCDSISLGSLSLFVLPKEVCSFQLRVLNIVNNFIQCLPPEIDRLHGLEVLYASGNPIKRLPLQIQWLKKLSYLTIDFGPELSEQIVGWISKLEKETNLLSDSEIIPSKEIESMSAIDVLRRVIAALEPICVVCKETKAPAVLVVQPTALRRCLEAYSLKKK